MAEIKAACDIGARQRLRGKVALISGASRGIGEAIARAFHQDGAHVWISDIEIAGGERLAHELGARAEFRKLDVREEEDWSAVTGEILEAHDRLDVLVNNAAITGLENGSAAHDPENARLEDWRAVHRTNLDGLFLGCQHGIKAMRRAGVGSIINISSRSGIVGIPAAAAYASSKAAVRNHTKTVALWCALQGLSIRCNSIHPAAILTPMWEPMLGMGPEREARIQMIVKDTPLRRFGLPEEVAAVALLLASNEAPYVTGSEFHIDGGLLAGSAGTP